MLGRALGNVGEARRKGREAFVRRPFLRPLVAFVALTSVWGSSFYFTELSLRSFSYIQVATLRVMLGFGVLALLAAAMRLPLPRKPHHYLHFLVLGATSIALPFLLITAAQQHIDSSLAVILVSTTPIFVFIITTVLGMSKLGIATLSGILVSFAGVGSLYVGDSLSAAGSSIKWPLAAVACALLFAAGNVYTGRYLTGVHPIVIALLQLAAAMGIMMPILLVSGIPTYPVDMASVAGVVELGVFGSALAYVLFSYLIQEWGSTATSINTYLQPIVGLLLGVFALGEYISRRTWGSIAAILIGVLIFAFGSWRQLSRVKASAVTNF